MRIPSASLLFLLLASPAVPTVQAGGREELEPPLLYKLRIGTEEVPLEAGKPTAIKGEFQDPEVVLVPSAERQFDAAGVRFKYPAHFNFEADFSSPGLKIWTLDGRNATVMLQAMEAPVPLDEMRTTLLDQYGGQAKAKATTRTIGKRQFKGFHITMVLNGINVTQDVLLLPSGKGSRFLLLQDLPQEGSTEEAARTLELLGETLDLAEPAAAGGPDLR